MQTMLNHKNLNEFNLNSLKLSPGSYLFLVTSLKLKIYKSMIYSMRVH